MTEKCVRRKTNSATELMKIIAAEVVSGKTAGIMTAARVHARAAAEDYVSQHLDAGAMDIVREEAGRVGRKAAQEEVCNPRHWESVEGIARRTATNEIRHNIEVYARSAAEERTNEILAKGKSCQELMGLTRAGKSWPEIEDRVLEAELKKAIRIISDNHGRTEGAIISRISQSNKCREVLGLAGSAKERW